MPSKHEYRPDRQPGKRGAFEKNRKTILYRDSVCAICGRPVDKSLPASDPMSACIDHIIPVSRGGDPTDLANLQLTHKICNERKANKLPKPNQEKKNPEITNRDLPWSINWLEYDGAKGWPPEDNE